MLSQYLYRDAAEVFVAEPAGRERDLGLAAALLNEPPVTAGKIERAQQLLADVAAGGMDETGAYARYLLARIKHAHLSAPVTEVEQAYRAILAASPGSVAAQLAAAQLALVQLYQRPDLAVEARIAGAAALAVVAGNRRLPGIAAAYYQQLAGAALFYRVTDARVLGWLETAYRIGLSTPIEQSTLALQTAEVARELGQRDIALDYYQRFLASAVATDQRYHTVETRMNELRGTEGGR
ncbi:MAG: hypothetical protein IT582_11055 [Opitutaceae bacterium]|nr:hypothetical protein [Opitutaceae bacterium]